MSLIDSQNSLIIDVTYNCNAKCEYCQWGNPKTSGRENQPNEYIYLDKENLKTLNTQRIVLSGGEPLLRQDLEMIISYYKDTVESLVIITNGFLLSEKRLLKLIKSGMTGVTFSIDGISDKVLERIRKYSPKQIEKLKNNFQNTLKYREQLEIGINAVVSSENIKGQELLELIRFANNAQIDWLKFQPIFDDGYVGKNAPWLLLNSEHSELIKKLGLQITQSAKIETNPIEFWDVLASVLKDKRLKGKSCGLDTRQTIAQKGELKICSWIDYPRESLYSLSEDEILNMQKDFTKQKEQCNTGTFCFCLQNLNHKWELE